MNARRLPDDLVLGEHVVLHGEVRIGRGCRIEDGAIIGRLPRLSRNSSAPRTEPEPTTLEDGAVLRRRDVFAGARICAGAIVGDQAHLRERAVLGPDRCSAAAARLATTPSSARGSDPDQRLAHLVDGRRGRRLRRSKVVTTNDDDVSPGQPTDQCVRRCCGAVARSEGAPAHARRRGRRGGVRRRGRGRHARRAAPGLVMGVPARVVRQR